MSTIDKQSGYESIKPLQNNFQIKYRTYFNHKGVLPHWHEHIELLYFISGRSEFYVGGKSYVAKAGDLAVFNPTEVHSVICQDEVEYDCILIYPDFFSDVSYGSTVIESLITDDKAIKELMAELREIGSDTGWDMMQKAIVYRLMAYLMRNYKADLPTSREQKKHSESLERLDKVIKYMKENYQSEISTAALASMCYISEAHFCRFFKKQTGKTAIEYINEYRVSKAERLLSETVLSITDIADSVGFEDVNYFSRVFKKTVGKSPSEYRRAR